MRRKKEKREKEEKVEEVKNFTRNKDLEQEAYDLYTTKYDRTNYIIVILAIFILIALVIFL